MLVEAQGIGVEIGGRSVLADESLRCEPGSMTALVGPSGCGKTTLLNCLGLLLPVGRGRVLLGGKDLTGAGPAARRRFWRDHAAFVLQDYGIMEQESVAFNVMMRGRILRPRACSGDQRLAAVLELTGLAGRQDEPAGRLSGGEKQRLALARAVHKRAAVLFVDEPTASLDADNRRTVIDLLTRLAADGRTVIVSTHDAEVIEACGLRHKVGADRAADEQRH